MTAVRVTPGNAHGVLGENPSMTTERDPSPIHGVLPSAPPPQPQPRRRWPWAVAAVVVAAALGASAVLLLDRPSTPTPAAGNTFTMTGELSVSGALWDNQSGVTPTPCTATGGYTDIVAGAAVVVQNPQGQTVATGALQSGREGEGYTCQFPFTVPGVPGNLSSYSVTIGHRGTQVLDPLSAKEPVELSLGGS